MFRPMKEMEVTIAQIDRLRMVHFYELTGISAGDAKTQLTEEHLVSGAMAVAVYYGEKEQINLSELDECYSDLVTKVFALYQASSDRSQIMMDEATRSILEQGVAPLGKDLWRAFYSQKPAVIPEISFDSLWSKRFAPMVEYLLCGLYKASKMDLSIFRRDYGWRGATLLSGELNGEKSTHYFRVMRLDDDHYRIQITPFLKTEVNLVVKVSLSVESISLVFEAEGMDYEGESLFFFGEKECRERHIVNLGGQCIFYADETKPYREGELPESVRVLAPEIDGVTSYISLPIGITWARAVAKKVEGEMEVEKTCGILFYEQAAFAEFRTATDITNKKTGIKVRTRAEQVLRMKVTKGKLQTYFRPVAGNVGGHYRKLLEGHYFIG